MTREERIFAGMCKAVAIGVSTKDSIIRSFIGSLSDAKLTELESAYWDLMPHGDPEKE